MPGPKVSFIMEVPLYWYQSVVLLKMAVVINYYIFVLFSLSFLLFQRFCNVTCCKRYSAEKRYYPYGRDEEGVQMSISQGLVNRHRSLKSNSARAKKV